MLVMWWEEAKRRASGPAGSRDTLRDLPRRCAEAAAQKQLGASPNKPPIPPFPIAVERASEKLALRRVWIVLACDRHFVS